MSRLSKADGSHSSDARWQYVHGIEQAAEDFIAANSAGPLDVAREVWRLREQEQPFSEGWGYHIAPELFLTVAAILDEDQVLLPAIANAVDWPLLIQFIDNAGLLGGDDIFEIGGSFLDLLNPSRTRSQDAEFDSNRSIRVDVESAAPTKLRLIFASGLFEESSGIHKTLNHGPCSKRELTPIFAEHGIPIEYYDAYRREQAQIASVELFAWARNHLLKGGLLVINNALSPSVSPTMQQLSFLGFAPCARLFAKSSQPGAFRVSVSVYHAEEPRFSNQPITAKCEFYSPTSQHGSLPIHRVRQWHWLGTRLKASWLPARDGQESLRG